MKERPILFSATMVRAIIEGRKTQTRRVMNVQPLIDSCQLARCISSSDSKKVNKFHWVNVDRSDNYKDNRYFTCPYGQAGDRLWVRETFCPIYPQDPTYNGGEPIEYDYAATYKHGDRLGDFVCIKKVWKPSIHMPRCASRITLEITGVRVERLQDISEADAVAEGISRITKDGRLFKHGIPDRDGLPGNDDDGWHWQEWEVYPRDAYQTLWESINGPESWDSNPWVWVVEFKKV